MPEFSRSTGIRGSPPRPSSPPMSRLELASAAIASVCRSSALFTPCPQGREGGRCGRLHHLNISTNRPFAVASRLYRRQSGKHNHECVLKDRHGRGHPSNPGRQARRGDGAASRSMLTANPWPCSGVAACSEVNRLAQGIKRPSPTICDMAAPSAHRRHLDGSCSIQAVGGLRSP